MRTREDRLFSRFRRTGDADALAAVFDRTAPDLLRLARFLVGTDVADDLVQATFVDAIEHAQRYDELRAVRPWLCGMLANHARRHRRDIAREREALRAGALLAGTLPTEPPADEAAAETERAQQIRRVIDSLAEPYAHVLKLHLDEGLNAGEIAARLRRPAGTVRTQLVRAFERLRRRMPSLTAGAAFISTRPTLADLTAIRHHVVALAQRRAPTALVTTNSTFLLGLIAMKKILLGVAAVTIALVATALIVFRGGDAPTQANPDVATHSAAGSTDVGSIENAPGLVDARPLRTPTEGASAATDELVDAVRLRVLDARRTPIADRLVSIRLDERLLERRTTDAAGLIEIDALPDAAVVQAGAVRTIANDLPKSADGVWEFVLPDGPRVLGRVVDATSLPVAGAEVWIHRWTSGDSAPIDPVAHSDAAGRFALTAPGSETVVLIVRKPGYESVGTLVVAVGTDDLVVRLTATGRRLTGRVLDPDGAPFAHARITLSMLGDTERRLGDTLGHEFDCVIDADADGRFDVGWLPSGSGVAAVTDAPIRGPLATFAWTATAAFDLREATSQDVTLQGTAPGRIDVRLVDGLEQPIAGVTVVATLDGARYVLDPPLTDMARTDSEGLATLDGLAPGTHLVRVSNPTLSAEAEVTVRPGLTTDVLLRAAQETVALEVELTDRQGAPLAGLLVAVRSASSLPARVSTDEDGVARFDRLQADRRCEVVVLQDGLPAARRTDVDPGAGRVRITFDPDASAPGIVRGRILGAEPVQGSVLLVPEGSGQQVPAEIQADGSFRFRPVVAANYTLHLQSDSHVFAPRPITVAPKGTTDLGDLTASRGATLTLRIPGLVASEADAMRVRFGPPTDSLPLTRDPSTTDAWTLTRPQLPGAGTVTVIGPTTIPLVMEIDLSPGPNRIELDRPPSGSPVRIDIRFEAPHEGPFGGVAHGILHIRTASGAAVASERFFGQFDDVDARLLIRRLALRPGAYEVEVSDGEHGATVPFEVPDASTPTVVVVSVR